MENHDELIILDGFGGTDEGVPRDHEMARAMTIAGFIVAALVLVIFGLDLTLRIPFQRASWMMDAGFVVSAIILAYLSWTAYRELR